MKLFMWRSEYLRDYGAGTIIAMGETVAEARAVARVAQEVHLRERWGFLQDTDNADSLEQIQELHQLFENDIAGGPEEIAGAVLIEGSA
jgi:hypothetical protein